ncbi:MAG: hypothetical protein COU31_00985 [Candidatus Magasanikbacteria bacterium CG10_big_fil_rev_8_21_14_0_10_40_10]|uniref:Squalene cyclase C-terminal domain-containing protein n=1 Tax=Candidatus Magasanikbacteria bacterium CG10_big_fil_rev_8_21_14_0_10_40_10 TaxID=1974648 RepID=A0A2M6W4R4_9BACT|nr:MAG: hypothetical protein COU31_00985 [Candidatus Magasanikbacteria bacterium CG10_big_fil_rev_8_21_14_0_10_40_10]
MKKAIFSLFFLLTAIGLAIASANAENMAVAANTASTTPFTTTTTTVLTVNFNLRYLDQFIWQGQIELASTTFALVKDSDTKEIATTTLFGPTVLTALIQADQATDSFFLSDLQYYASYNSYYLACLQFASTSACYNWQYAIDDQYPMVSLDQYALAGDEDVYMYFGAPCKITASTSSLALGTTTTLQTWRYNYDNLNQEWTPDPNDSIDISIDNPNSTDWSNIYLTIATTSSQTDGTIDYLFSSTGTYYAKIVSENWSKWSNPITITVNEPALLASTTTIDIATGTIDITTSTAPASTTPATGGEEKNSDSGQEETPEGTPSPEQTNAPALINNQTIQQTADKLWQYLISQQSSDGKIIDHGITDWMIMSAVANSQNPNNIKKGEKSLLQSALNYDFSDPTDLNLCAAYPRHWLALYTAGLPADGQTLTEIKKHIKEDCVFGNAYGQNGINDDIFALMALLANGESANDTVVNLLLSSVKSDQQTDGSFTWGGYSGADITGGAINVLSYAKSKGLSVEQNIFDQALSYLRANQLSDGGWTSYGNTSDVMTTAWVMMGLNALGQTQSQWLSDLGKNPWNILIENLTEQNYYESPYSLGQPDWFALKHALPALLSMSWPIAPKYANSDPAGQNQDNNPSAQTDQKLNLDELIEIEKELNNATSSLIKATSTLPLENISSTSTPATSTEQIANLPITIVSSSLISAPISRSRNPILVSTPIPASSPYEQESVDLAKSADEISSLIPLPAEQILSAGPSQTDNDKQKLQQLADNLPLDTPARNTAKKALAGFGAGALGLGLLLGFRVIKNMV